MSLVSAATQAATSAPKPYAWNVVRALGETGAAFLRRRSGRVHVKICCIASDAEAEATLFVREVRQFNGLGASFFRK